MAPNGAGRIFFLLIQTLPTFWAERISILRILIFGISFGFQISRFPGPQISRFPKNRSLFVGRPFFRKLFASKNDVERYRRNILGPNFQKHILFLFKDLRVLATKILLPGPVVPRSWYQDPGTRILVPGFWDQDPGTKILVPRSWYQGLAPRSLVPRSWGRTGS